MTPFEFKFDYTVLAALAVFLLPIRVEKVLADPSFWEIAGLVGYVVIIIRCVQVWRFFSRSRAYQ